MGGFGDMYKGDKRKLKKSQLEKGTTATYSECLAIASSRDHQKGKKNEK